jgi:hypothetical protein
MRTLPAILAAGTALGLGALGFGCGSTRTSHTPRTATEQLVLTQAWDEALNQIDFSELAGVPVYLEASGVTGIDQGWITSSLRQALLEHGALLRSKAEEAQWIVEARVGAYATDDSHFLIGIPQVTVPQVVPGVPSGTIPEMPLMKKTHQKGVAKLALFAYDRATGQLVWSSGTSQSTANAKDLYVGGLGPIQRGSIRRGTEFMGVRILAPLGKAPPDSTPDKEASPILEAPARSETATEPTGKRSAP